MECSQAFPSSEKPFPLLIRDEIHQAAGYGDHLAHGKSIESLFDDVYSELPWHLAEQRDQLIEELEGSHE